MAVDVKSARDAFMQLYADLTEVLPMNQPQLKAELYTNNLLPGDHKAKIDSLNTQKEKAEYFLDAVIKPSLNIGYTEQFEKLICIMGASDNPTLRYLSNQIRGRVAGLPSVLSSSSDGKGMHIIYYNPECGHIIVSN